VLKDILMEIDNEIARLREVRSLLTSGTSSNRGGNKRVATKASPQKTKKRTLSPEARERIRQAQLKRWAATKKANKTAK
jgi:hypothetical protein